jgi:Protein of unknown function (DUF4058)
MPSPFPGMDPWLESPHIWGDFHQAFVCGLSAYLNELLPKGYYSRINFRLNADESKHQYAEIRNTDHDLLTFIDFATPRNKATGPERRSYLRNRKKLLESKVSFVEFDFLRGGKAHNEKRDDDDEDERSSLPEYSIVIRTAEKPARMCRSYSWDVRVRAPEISIPFRPGVQRVHVDVQKIIDKVYDNGPYDQGAVEYDEPPDPPLPPELANWAAECLRKAGMIV